MTDGIKITGGGGGLLSTVTTSSSAVTFNNIGFQKITFDGDTFDSMDDFYDHVRTLRAENARLRDLLGGFYASQDIEDALK